MFGYQEFLWRNGAAKILEEHVRNALKSFGLQTEIHTIIQFDSFASIMFPQDPEIWKTDLCPSGTMEKWILADKRTDLPSYITKSVSLLVVLCF